jgi:hypothetical protein
MAKVEIGATSDVENWNNFSLPQTDILACASPEKNYNKTHSLLSLSSF